MRRRQWIASALALPLGPAISLDQHGAGDEAGARQGLGTRLLQRCFAEIEASGATAGLDATELGPADLSAARLPRRLSAVALARGAGARGRRSTPPRRRARCAAATSDDLPRIVRATMRRIRGFARGRILDHLLARAPSLAHVAERARWHARRLRPGPRRTCAPCMSAPSWPRTRRSGSRCSARAMAAATGARDPGCARPASRHHARWLRGTGRDRAARLHAHAARALPGRRGRAPASSPLPGPELA